MFPLDGYRTYPVKISDMLRDFGCSGGEYALEPEALERFKDAAKKNNIKYNVKQYEDLFEDTLDLFIVNIDIISRGRKQPTLDTSLNDEDIKDPVYRDSCAEFVTKKKKVARNAPCPCGSGKKYKKCCLNKSD